jgi:hypothetical protein
MTSAVMEGRQGEDAEAAAEGEAAEGEAVEAAAE